MRLTWKYGAILILAVAIVYFGFLTIRGPRRIVAMVPSTDGTWAVVLQTAGAGDRMVRVDLDGGKRWEADVPLFRPGAAWAGVSAGGSAVTLRALPKDGTFETFGFDAATGEGRWTAADSGLKPKVAVPPYITRLADDAVVYELHMTKPHALFAVDRATGKQLWKSAIPEDYFDVDYVLRGWLRNDFVVLDQPDTLALFDRGTGVVVPIRVRRTPCVLEDRVLYEPESESVLISRSLVDGRETAPVPLPGNLGGSCGTRGGAVVAGIEDEHHGRVAGLDPDTLETRWDLPLGPFSLETVAGREERVSYPDLAPLTGDLPRFVPLQVVDWGLGKSKEEQPDALHGLVMLDLDAHAVAWGASNPDLVDFALFGQDGRYYLVKDTLVGLLDGATGELVKAVRVKDAQPIQPYHLAGGKLWIYRWDAVGALDATTLDIAGGGWKWVPFEVADATAEMRKMLSMDP